MRAFLSRFSAGMPFARAVGTLLLLIFLGSVFAQPATRNEKPKDKEDEKAVAGTLRPADLALEAEQTKEPALRDVYRKLTLPHDVVHWANRETTTRAAPIYRYVDASTDFKDAIKVYPLDAKGKIGPSSSARRGEIKRIEPYEDIALNEVKALLDPKGPAKGVPRLTVLQAAERVLTVVARFHETARADGTREGTAWDAVSKRLRDQLLQVQSDTLGALAEADDWDRAYEMAERLTRSHKDADVLARFAKPMSGFIAHSLKAEKYNEVSERLKLLQEIFPGDALSRHVNELLSRKASELFEKAKLEKDKAQAIALLTTAENLFPRLPGLRDYRLHLSNAYPILYVGVPSLPENLSPGAARTNPERWAVELLFESLIRPVVEPGVGERYRPVLADGRPELLPLGREFAIARDAYWSDGKPVTGVDVRETLRLLRAQGKASLVEEARLGSDAYHVRITLTQGYVDPLGLMSFKVLPESARLEKWDDANFARQPVGSGPFVFQKRDKDTAIFVANHNYRRAGKAGLPRIREVRFFISKNPAADFQQQRLHLLLDPAAVMKVQDANRVKVHALPNRRVYFLAVNHRKPVLQDQDVRRALALAIDRTKILDEVFRAGWKSDEKPHRPLNGPYPANSWACPPGLKMDLCNLPVAAAKVKEIEKRRGTPKLVLKYPSGDPAGQQACEMIRTQATAAGMDLRIEPRMPAQLRKDVEVDHDYDLAYYHWDFASEAFLLWPLFDPKATGRGGSNFLGFQPDADLQSWFNRVLDHRDFPLVKQYTHTIHGILQEKMPLIPLWQLDTVMALREELKTSPDPTRLDPLSIFTDVERWEIK